MKAKKTEYEMTSLEIENLLRQLKVELGIEGESKGGSNKTFLGDLLSSRTSKERTPPALPPAPPHRKTLQEIKEGDRRKQEEQKVLDDLSQREIKQILKDASLGNNLPFLLSFCII